MTTEHQTDEAAQSEDQASEFDAAFDHIASGKPLEDLEEISTDEEEGNVPETSDEYDDDTTADEEENNSGQNTDVETIWESVDETVRSAHETVVAELNDRIKDLEHRYQSDFGRVAGVQSENSSLRKQIAAFQSAAKEIKKSDTDPLKVLEGIEDDYGDIAGPIKQAIELVVAQNNDLRETVHQVREKSEADMQEERNNQVLEAHPDFTDLVNNHNFAVWYRDLDEYDRDIFHANAEQIIHPAKVIRLLDDFKQSEHFQTPAAKQPVKPENPVIGENDASQLKERRERQKVSSKSARAKGTVNPQDNAPDDFDSAFEYYARKSRKEYV